MGEMRGERHMGRSIGAMAAGVAAGIGLTLGTDALMHASGVFPPLGQPMSDGLFALATAYRTVYGIGGSYLAARLAPNRPMRHAMIPGVLGLIACIAGAAATWNNGPEYGPHWYPLSLIALALPKSWAGGKIRESQLQC